MDRKKYLIVTAGGSGTRMGGTIPKQFLELGGVPILRMSVEKFLSAVPGIQVITVLPEAHVSYWRQYCLAAGFTCPQRLVKGGFTRFHSVKNALQYVPDGALVAVHDAVRPLISTRRLRELFEEASAVPALIPVIPLTDTLKVLQREAGALRSTGEQVDRSRIFGAQTPQIFYSEALKEAYERGFDPQFTDDASVAEHAGITLSFTEGEKTNLKITTPEDLQLAEALLQSRPV